MAPSEPWRQNMIPSAAGTDSASHISDNHPNAGRFSLSNPLPLSAAQEAQVKALYYKRVRLRCDDEIKRFAECARGRTVTATWTCRDQRLAMNSCMVLNATPAEEDLAREEWFAGIRERRRKREEDLEAVEKRREEVIQMTRRQEEKERMIEEEQKREKERDREQEARRVQISNSTTAALKDTTGTKETPEERPSQESKRWWWR